MSKKLITEQYLTDIADAINTKVKDNKQYTPPEMAAAIMAIPSGGKTELLKYGFGPSYVMERPDYRIKYGFGPSYVMERPDYRIKYGFGASYAIEMAHTGIYYGYGTTQTGSTSAGTLE